MTSDQFPPWKPGWTLPKQPDCFGWRTLGEVAATVANRLLIAANDNDPLPPDEKKEAA